MRGKSFHVPAIAMACLLGGFALVCAVPMPEEQVWATFNKIDVGPFDWKGGTTAREAWDELNEDLRKQGCTKYSIVLAKGVLTLDPEDAASFKAFDGEELQAPGDVAISLKLDKAIPATECIRCVAELSGCYFRPTREGILIYSIQNGPPPDPPSWRREFRNWLRFEVPRIWRRITDGK